MDLGRFDAFLSSAAQGPAFAIVMMHEGIGGFVAGFHGLGIPGDLGAATDLGSEAPEKHDLGERRGVVEIRFGHGRVFGFAAGDPLGVMTG